MSVLYKVCLALLVCACADGALTTVNAQVPVTLRWDETTPSAVLGYAVTIDGVRTDYGLSPVDWSGLCGCSIAVPFWGGYHTIVVSAYGASAETPSVPLLVGPVANIGGPYSAYTGIALSADASGSDHPAGTITTYRWSWGDGSASTTSSPGNSHIYTTSGTYTLRLTVTDNAGATATATTTVTVTTPRLVTADAVTPASGTGTTQTFVLQYSDTAGATNLSTVWSWFNPSLATTGASPCLVYYDRAASQLHLLNDAGTEWTAAAPGGAGTLQNAQCAIALGSTTVTLSGTSLTLKLAMTFSSGYAGTKNIYLYAAGAGGVNSGWQPRGTWTVPGATGIPSADAVTPASGTGNAQTFVLQYSHTAGAANLSTVWSWFNRTLATTSASSCLVYYDRAANQVRLLNDLATDWIADAPGSVATLQNAQCGVELWNTTVTLSGTSLTLRLAMTFNAAYAGTKNVYLFAAAPGGVNTGWQARGTWTVSSATGVVTADAVTPPAGSGTVQRFALQYSDTDGAANLSTVWSWFNATLSTTGASSCLVYYDRATNQLHLLDDEGALWLTAAPGSSGTLKNSQCAVTLSATTVTLDGPVLTLNLAMTFSTAFSGAKNTYLFAAGAGGASSGWQARGTWFVPNTSGL